MGGLSPYVWNEWTVAIFLIGLLVAAAEIGFRVGRHKKTDGDQLSETVAIQAAALGLLGLLLGFTFSMSLSRYENRLWLAVTEANDIGTTALRARELPEPHASQVADLLRQYTDARLDLHSPGVPPDRVRRAETRSAELQQQLWSHSVAVAESDPRSVPAGLFTQSLNNMIDDHAKRAAAARNHVPAAVIGMLLLVSILAMALTGYCSGITGYRNPLLALVVSLLISSVIFVILDMDRPQKGLIRVSQQAMVDLRDGMRAGFP